MTAQRSEEDEDMFSDSENDDDQYAFESDEETRRRVQALQRAQAEQAATAAQRPAGEQPAAFGGEPEHSPVGCRNRLQACPQAGVCALHAQAAASIELSSTAASGDVSLTEVLRRPQALQRGS